jgi:hypothetical protein
MFGPFHRRIDSEDVIRKIEASGELWGTSPRNILQSDFPKAMAYRGPLPDGQRGFEFETDVEPDRGCPPDQAYWSNGRPGVKVEGAYAKIQVRLRKIRL